MTAPITAARTGGLSFRLGGIPVTIHVSFLLVVGLLGVLGLGAGAVDRLIVWVGVATAAILLHELGHAVVGRLAGLTPRIDLAGFGGVTSWSAQDSTRRSERRGWSLAISVAGPGIGFVGGAAALPLGAPCCLGPPAGSDLATFAAGVWLFASFAWGILNLLPILPLDGGQALRSLLPGSPAVRLRRAALVGVVVGAALAAWALVGGRTFLALLAGWIAWSNVQQVQAARQGTRPAVTALTAAHEAHSRGDLDTALQEAAVAARDADDRTRAMAVVLALDSLLRTGRAAEAWALLRDPRLDVTLAPQQLGAVLATHPDTHTIDEVVRGWVRRNGDPYARGAAAVVLARHGLHDEAAAMVRAGRVDAPVALEVQERLHVAGQFPLAGQLGWYLVAEATEPIQDPRLAYNTACSLARAGDVESAVRALQLARQRGFADARLLQEDEDLASLRSHPAWPGLT